jgi:S1-C subfamily serine protease
MATEHDWQIPLALRPQPEEVSFDLENVLASVVSLRSEVAPDAYTATVLGTQRQGSGIVIGDGIVVTIGYLIVEAEAVWLFTGNGQAVPAHVAAYDHATGFGLVEALGRLDAPSIRRGAAQFCDVGDDLILACHGGRDNALNVNVASKREFAGYWEYLLDEALYTAPAHPHWSGAALIGGDGTLRGVGSLLIDSDEMGGSQNGNVSVPIDLLDPILDDMLRFGRVCRPAPPWLGLFAVDAPQGLVVAGLVRGGPAHRAGIQVGDAVCGVADQPVADLADLLRKVRALGPAGTEVPLVIDRDDHRRGITVKAADRRDYLKKPRLH